VSDLTPRQREVLLLLWQGLSRDEAGARLGIAEQTVRNHVREIFARLAVGRLVDAFRAAGLALDGLPDVRPLGVYEAAEALGVHANTLKRLPASALPYFRVGSRGDRRYRRDDVAAYISGRTER
jgi:DNA-binding CsgD family transcriptional regulator